MPAPRRAVLFPVGGRCERFGPLESVHKSLWTPAPSLPPPLAVASEVWARNGAERQLAVFRAGHGATPSDLPPGLRERLHLCEDPRPDVGRGWGLWHGVVRWPWAEEWVVHNPDDLLLLSPEEIEEFLEPGVSAAASLVCVRETEVQGTGSLWREPSGRGWRHVGLTRLHRAAVEEIRARGEAGASGHFEDHLLRDLWAQDRVRVVGVSAERWHALDQPWDGGWYRTVLE